MDTLVRRLFYLALFMGILALGHLAVIEIGREVVTVRTQRPDGSWRETRLWVVDHEGAVWLHSAGEDWVPRFNRETPVELERDGEVRRYSAQAVPEEHEAIDEKLREKYGWADEWVRFLAPCDEELDATPIRLELIDD